jgi:dUTP pyrophosphatase
MVPLIIKVVNTSNNPLPQYVTEGAAGMDIKAFLDVPLLLAPMERTLIATGLFIELPGGFEAQIRPRSGLAINQGITCLNSPGTVDSDYRGEIKIILINLSGQDQVIKPGDRIAQMVIQKVERATLVTVTKLNTSVRAESGFGSTGIK